MKSGPLHILIAIFLVLLGVLLTSYSLKNRSAENLLSPLQVGQIREIRIEHLLDGISLFEENGEWKVKKVISSLKKKLDESEGKVSVEDSSSYAAQEAQVLELLQQLHQVNLREIASLRPDQSAQFQVNEALGIKVQLFSSEKTISFIVGKTLPLQNFVSKLGETPNSTIYRIPDNLRPLLLRSIEDWKKSEALSSNTK